MHKNERNVQNQQAQMLLPVVWGLQYRQWASEDVKSIVSPTVISSMLDDPGVGYKDGSDILIFYFQKILPETFKVDSSIT